APSYVKYYLKHNSIAFERYPKLAKTFFDDGYLIPQKVRQWLQSVVDKALRTYIPPRSCTQVRTRQAGPARTIILYKRDGTIIDIDLVPVIECTLFLPRSSLDGRVESEVGNNLDAFLVPKPYSSFGRQRPINEREASRLWRSHFPEPEDDIIHDLGCVKPVIKLLKLLRDKEDWKCLASYYLKTVVMWMVLEIDNEDYWREDKMDKRFLDALQKLDRAVEQKRITYLFNKKYNLLEKLNDAQAFNIHCRLVYFIRKINENPRFLWSIFQETPLF
ncbi:cyclic GMP-AMP synthase-like receptor, partial [Parasteatoda tepidariorum]|uniref:cyclic GMP-AMP synthase-like receptor n=1 Tax=Parasteatoda tepidariorum TaxID=114398 RepID=UPI0039BC6227